MGIKYEFIDLTKESIDFKTLKELYSSEGLPLKKFFNTSGVEYRKNNVKDLFETLSDDELLKLISENGLLLKRPFIIGKKLYIGNKIEELVQDYNS